MGLAVEVGALADLISHDPGGAEWLREQLAAANRVLEREGFATHAEPEKLAPIPMPGMGGFPYSFLHYLRRAYALMRLGRQVSPVSGDDLTSADEQIIEEVTMQMDSHLLCHSDVEGLYVPVEFMDPIIDDQLAGATLGSSQKLRKELVEVASSIDINLEEDQLGPEQLAQLDDEANEGHRFETERVVWLTLFEAAAASIEHKTAILFN